MGSMLGTAVPVAVYHGPSINEALSEDLLLLVLHKLPPLEAFRAGALVCRTWLELLDSPRFFLGLMPQASLFREQPHWARLHRAVFGSNLLRGCASFTNPGGSTRYAASSAATGWAETQHGGQGFSWEHKPVGAPDTVPVPLQSWRERPLTGGRKTASCVASSYQWSEVMQVVDLEAVLQCGLGGHNPAAPGLARAFLDARPRLAFGVWLGGRWDCGAVGRAQLVLDDGAFVIPPYQAANRDARNWAPHALRVWDSGEVAAPRGGWQRLTAAVEVPPGARRAIVVLRGKDDSFWAGSYGAKFAAPQLVFSADEEPVALLQGPAA